MFLSEEIAHISLYVFLLPSIFPPHHPQECSSIFTHPVFACFSTAATSARRLFRFPVQMTQFTTFIQHHYIKNAVPVHIILQKPHTFQEHLQSFCKSKYESVSFYCLFLHFLTSEAHLIPNDLYAFDLHSRDATKTVIQNCVFQFWFVCSEITHCCGICVFHPCSCTVFFPIPNTCRRFVWR